MRTLTMMLWSLGIGSFFSPSLWGWDEWGHWRGPRGNGSAEASPPTEFSETKNLRWKVGIEGEGSGSPVVWKDQVFVVTSVPKAAAADVLSFQLLCFDRESGALRWKQTAIETRPNEATHTTNNYASASPCTDGEMVYAHFGSRGLFAYTMEGKLVWSKQFGVMTTRNGFGEGSSPTLEGDKILIPWDHEGPSILYCLNKKTGEEIWKTARDEPTCWATPLVVTYQGKKQVVMNGEKSARSYDLSTGVELWRCAGQTQRPAASPVADGEMVYVGSGFRGAFLGAFRLDGKGDIQKTASVVWTLRQDTPDVASPVLSGHRLYFFKEKRGQLTCVDARTGKPLYQAERVPGLGTIYASPVAAGGHLYLADRDGVMVVIKDGDKFQVVHTTSLGETIDATPAVVGNELFVRSKSHLYCFARP